MRAAIGHAAAAPPSSATKSRRLMPNMKSPNRVKQNVLQPCATGRSALLLRRLGQLDSCAVALWLCAGHKLKPFLPEIGVRTLSLRRNGCQVLGADLLFRAATNEKSVDYTVLFSFDVMRSV